MEKSIRVRILDRAYGLRVEEEHEQETREISGFVDARLQAFRRAHPDQPELTAAVITAMAITEELFAAREQQVSAADSLDARLDELTTILDAALAPLDEDQTEEKVPPPVHRPNEGSMN